MPSEDPNLKYLAEIEARKLAQRGLKEGQNFLQGILSSLEDTFIVVFDKEGLINFVWGPKSLEERYGIKFHEYMGKSTTEFLSSIPNEEKLKIINDVFNTSTPVRMEFSMSMPNGMIWVDISVSPLADKEEGILAVIVAARDITKRKEVEQNLIESEEKFRLIAEQSKVGLLILKDSKFLYVNAKLCEMTGYSEEELLNWDIQKFLHRIHPDDLSSIIIAMKNRSEDKNISSSFELRFKQKSGKYIWLQQNTNPIQLKGEMVVLSVLIDVTDSKNAEKKLVYHNMLILNLAEAVISTDMEFNILSWNKAAEKIYGWEEKEVIGKNMDHIVIPEFNIPRGEVISDLMEKGFWKGEVIHHKKDGTHINILGSVSMVRNKNGDPTGAVAVLRDITERKAAEKIIKESEKRYSTIFQTVPYGIQLTDRDGQITFSNTTHHKIHGVKDGTLIGKKIWDFDISEENKRRTKEYYLEIINNPIKPVPFFTTNRLQDGRNIDVQVDWDYLRDINGETIGICSVISDVTDKNKRINELKESEGKFRLIFENVRDGIVGVNEEGNIEFANIAAANNLGYELDEFLKLNITDISVVESINEFKEHFSDMLAGKRLKFVTLHKKKDGIIRNVEVSIQVFDLKEKNISLAIWHDITEIKRVEEALTENEGIMRSILENSPDHILMVDNNFNIQFINHPFPGKKIDDFTYQNILNFIPPQYQKLVKDGIEQIFSVGKAEKIIITLLSGTLLQSFYEVRFGFIKRDWKTIAAIVILTDITEQKHHENLLIVQRDLATQLNGVSNFHEGLRLCLEAAIKCSQMDCGGIYLFDKKTGSLDLISHQGLPINFVKLTSHYKPDSKNVIIISKGEPIYNSYQKLDVDHKDIDQKEQLMAIAIIPIKHQNIVIGCLNIASHIYEEVPNFSRIALEIISAQIGIAIIALQVQEPEYQI